MQPSSSSSSRKKPAMTIYLCLAILVALACGQGVSAQFTGDMNTATQQQPTATTSTTSSSSTTTTSTASTTTANSSVFLEVENGQIVVEPLKDIFPGASSSFPDRLTAMDNGKVLFAANDGATGNELWVSDGTLEGTQLLLDINPGQLSSDPKDFTKFQDGLYAFSAFTQTTGREVWVTDGTPAGTRLLLDLYPGRPSSNPEDFVVLGSRLLLVAQNELYGRELWTTDGTIEGTWVVWDIRPGTAASNPRGVHETRKIGGTRLLFSADDGVNGQELYVTDGTAAGTTLLYDFTLGREGTTFEFARPNQNYNDVQKLYFGTFPIGFWVTDGTSEGTTLLHPSLSIATGSDIGRYEIDGRMYFLAYTAQSSTSDEIWETDGTAEGTRLVFNGFDKDGLACPGFDGLAWMPMILGRFGIIGVDGCGDALIWAFDGVSAQLVLNLGPRVPRDGEFLPTRGKFIFTAQGLAFNGVSFDEIYYTDYTLKGTQKITTMSNNVPCCDDDGNVQQTTLLTRDYYYNASEDVVLLRGSDDNGFELFKLTWTTQEIMAVAAKGFGGSNGKSSGLTAQPLPGPASFVILVCTFLACILL